jgi:hypothetical protein
LFVKPEEVVETFGFPKPGVRNVERSNLILGVGDEQSCTGGILHVRIVSVTGAKAKMSIKLSLPLSEGTGPSFTLDAFKKDPPATAAINKDFLFAYGRPLSVLVELMGKKGLKTVVLGSANLKLEKNNLFALHEESLGSVKIELHTRFVSCAATIFAPPKAVALPPLRLHLP